MHITGGPVRTDGAPADRSLRGKVDAFRSANFVTYPDHTSGFDAAPIRTVATDANGRFRMSLAPGVYRLRGDPDSIGTDNLNSQPFTIKAGQSTSVDLVINAF